MAVPVTPPESPYPLNSVSWNSKPNLNRCLPRVYETLSVAAVSAEEHVHLPVPVAPKLLKPVIVTNGKAVGH